MKTSFWKIGIPVLLGSIVIVTFVIISPPIIPSPEPISPGVDPPIQNPTKTSTPSQGPDTPNPGDLITVTAPNTVTPYATSTIVPPTIQISGMPPEFTLLCDVVRNIEGKDTENVPYKFVEVSYEITLDQPAEFNYLFVLRDNYISNNASGFSVWEDIFIWEGEVSNRKFDMFTCYSGCSGYYQVTSIGVSKSTPSDDIPDSYDYEGGGPQCDFSISAPALAP